MDQRSPKDPRYQRLMACIFEPAWKGRPGILLGGISTTPLTGPTCRVNRYAPSQEKGARNYPFFFGEVQVKSRNLSQDESATSTSTRPHTRTTHIMRQISANHGQSPHPPLSLANHSLMRIQRWRTSVQLQQTLVSNIGKRMELRSPTTLWHEWRVARWFVLLAYVGLVKADKYIYIQTVQVTPRPYHLRYPPPPPFPPSTHLFRSSHPLFSAHGTQPYTTEGITSKAWDLHMKEHHEGSHPLVLTHTHTQPTSLPSLLFIFLPLSLPSIPCFSFT